MNFDDKAVLILVSFITLFLVLLFPLIKTASKIAKLSFKGVAVKHKVKLPDDHIEIQLYGGDRVYLFLSFTKDGTPYLDFLGKEKPLHRDQEYYCLILKKWNHMFQIPHNYLDKCFGKLWDIDPLLQEAQIIRLHKLFGGYDLAERINNYIILYYLFYGKKPLHIFYGSDVPDLTPAQIRDIELKVSGYTTEMRPMFEESPQPCLNIQGQQDEPELHRAFQWFYDKYINVLLGKN